MKVAVVGGKLQGTEVTYLAAKAGWEVVLIDKCRGTPASGLSDQFIHLDVTRPEAAAEVIQQTDLIIPALEDDIALPALVDISIRTGTPLAFDPEAYAVSSSKTRSETVFRQLGLSVPEPWPECGFPVVIKPDNSSGSQEVRLIHSRKELDATVKSAFPKPVIQAYLDGPSFSIEVMGRPGYYVPLQVTRLLMDDGHDCRQVKAPAGLDKQLVRRFEAMGVRIARAINLKGLMDVEIILNDNELKVLEIDARFPSQTPIAVYRSTGMNMVELLKDIFTDNAFKGFQPVRTGQPVIYEHVRVSEAGLQFAGEHIMATAGPLRIIENFFGAREAITNYKKGAHQWVATLIHMGSSEQDVKRTRDDVIQNIKDEIGT